MYSIVPAHEGDKLKWKVIFNGQPCIETTCQDFAEDFAYLMNAARGERLARMSGKARLAVEK